MVQAQSEHDAAGTCPCAWCSVAHPFEMPDRLVEACMDGDLVVFAGAGVSTEQRTVIQYTFYDEVLAEIGGDPAENMPFPSVMSAFEEQNGRMALLEMIKKRLDYVRSFPN